MAPTVSVGAALPEIVETKSWPQCWGLRLCAGQSSHNSRRCSASVWRALLEAEKKVGKVWPGTVPLDALAYSFAVSNAVCNWGRRAAERRLSTIHVVREAATAPTVVSSFITM